MSRKLCSNGRLAQTILLAGIAAAACTPTPDGNGGSTTTGSGGRTASGGSASSPSGGSSASGGNGGSSAVGGNAGGGGSGGGAGGESSGGAGGDAPSGSGGDSGGGGGGPDAAVATDGGSAPPPSSDGPPSYEGDLNLFEGPPVGPEVVMACPEDPLGGFVEYKDTFQVGRPYDVPLNTRFSMEGGIYTFWVQKNDKPQKTDTTALNPRTEARFGQTFTTGVRAFSGDLFLEKTANGSVVMQVHTTTTGIGPVYLHAEGNSLAGSSVKSTDIPGGLYDNWFNLKVIIDAATTESKIFINNCLKTTQKGTRGNGIDYFKFGIYHCGSAVCRDKYKNVHVYLQK
jgi:hypothetical protein